MSHRHLNKIEDHARGAREVSWLAIVIGLANLLLSAIILWRLS